MGSAAQDAPVQAAPEKGQKLVPPIKPVIDAVGRQHFDALGIIRRMRGNGEFEQWARVWEIVKRGR